MALRKTALLAAAAAAVLSWAALAQETVNLNTVGSNPGTANYDDIHLPFWTEHIEQASGGRITADSVSQQQVGFKGPEFFRMIGRGVADIGTAPISYASGDVQALEIVDIPGVVQNIDEMREAMDVARPHIEDLLRERLGVEPLAFWPTGGQVVWCGAEIGSLADLAGKKVRVFGAAQSDFIEGLGGIPVTIPFSEVVPGIQRGVVDCAITGANSGNLANWTEVTTHLIPIIAGWSVMAMTANLDRWNSLPEDVQATIKQEAASFAEARGWQMAADATDHGIWCTVGDDRCDPSKGGVREFNKTNLTLVELSDEDRARVRSVLEDTVLPGFAERCGEECTTMFNETVGKAMGIEATPG